MLQLHQYPTIWLTILWMQHSNFFECKGSEQYLRHIERRHVLLLRSALPDRGGQNIQNDLVSHQHVAKAYLSISEVAPFKWTTGFIVCSWIYPDIINNWYSRNDILGTMELLRIRTDFSVPMDIIVPRSCVGMLMKIILRYLNPLSPQAILNPHSAQKPITAVAIHNK